MSRRVTAHGFSLTGALSEVWVHEACLLVQVPQAATVLCLPIEVLAPGLPGDDHTAYHEWNWQPNYREIDLKKNR